jgi:hypothetical protein
MLGSGGNKRTKTSTDDLLAACFQRGAPEKAVADYLSADVRHYLAAVACRRVAELSTASDVGLNQRMIAGLNSRADMQAVGVVDLVKSRYHDLEEEKGTRLERRLRWLARRPGVTIAGGIWLVVTAAYGHVEMLQQILIYVRKLWK